MPLTKLQFRPGVNKETTSYTNEGGWFESDKVRFRFGVPEKIGGWRKNSSKSFLGTCRALHNFVALDGSVYLGVGTFQKYYINEGGGFNDITPIRVTTSAGTPTFSAANNSLASDVDAGDLTITLTSASGFPSNGRVQIVNLADDDGVCASQTPSGAGNLTINGAYASSGTVTFKEARTVTITGASDESGKNFTVYGTDANSVSFSEVIAGPNATTVSSTNTFLTITQVEVSAATTGAITVGVTQGTPENVTYESISGNILTGCTRGVDGTTDKGHLATNSAVFANTIIVTSTSHGCTDGDFVEFSAATSLGGNITADVLNQEYEVAHVENDNTFHIDARAVATLGDITVDGVYTPTFVYSNASDSGNGGSSTVGKYQINIGINTSVTGSGWGASTWGRGTWGSSAPITTAGNQLRFWTHDNFGEDLILNIRNGNIYYWDKTSGLSSRAVPLSTLSGADSGTPTIAKKVIVSDRDRHVIAFGTDPFDNTGIQDPLLIRFSGQASPTVWTPSATNTAGDLRIGSGSEIITAVETRQQIIVFTDVSLHAMQFLGPPFTFGINQISENITIIGPMAAKASDDRVYWMGLEDFYVYDGRIQKLPCTLRSFVFDDFNLTQKEKTIAALNSSFSEIWWFYPSSSSQENDRYVIYNYAENTWAHGNLPRTAWVDRGINEYPIGASPDYYLYDHEFGLNDGSTSPESAITSYIESSQVDLADGEQYAFIRRLIPDVTFTGSDSDSPSANFILKARNFPGANYGTPQTSAVTRSATVPVEQFTNQAHVRLRGRSFAFRIESDTESVQWRLGSPRVDIRPDGRR